MRAELGRAVSLILYGVLCCLLGALGYRQALEPAVRRLAAARRAVGPVHGHAEGLGELCGAADQLLEVVDRGAR